MKDQNVVQEKSYKLALEVIHIVRVIPKKSESFVIINQLVKAGTSVGENVEEAIAGFSRNDFAHKMSIALKEARETNYWLRLIRDAEILQSERLDSCLLLSTEVKKILGAIVKTTRSQKV